MDKIAVPNKRYYLVNPAYPVKRILRIAIILFGFGISQPSCLNASQDIPCLAGIPPSDAVLITTPDGHILYKKNETKKYIPASTLKILTALTAIHHLGLSYRFKTEFYTDSNNNLIIKGYGDPLLTSEVWLEISAALCDKIHHFNNLILDVSYFPLKIQIPGVGNSTNPYDAPLGALCANFNTVFFDHDCKDNIISAEPQTPMTPFARKKIRSLGLKKGRYTFSHDQRDAAHYAGELLIHFLNKKGVRHTGDIRVGSVGPEDILIYTYQSSLTLEMVINKMMEFSNNFIANQICIAMGAHVYGSPGTLDNGVKVMTAYAEKQLHLKNMEIVEGSGISRKNRISALDMQTILEEFKPYRYLLKKTDKVLFKTGTLKNINNRAGYIESPPNDSYSFVVFLNSGSPNIESVMKCIEKLVPDEKAR